MIRSMTGYGAADSTLPGGSISVEIRSVNSRGLKVVVKGPPGREAWEPDLRAVVEKAVQRGRVDVFVRLDESAEAGGRTLDEDRVRELIEAANQLRDGFDVSGDLDVSTILRQPGVLRDRGDDAGFDPPVEAVAETLGQALELMIDMRDREGVRLAADLRERLEGIGRYVDGSEALAPERLERERARLQAAVTELAGKELDEDRLAREIAVLADKWDVGEELVRARSHIEAFEEFLQAADDEPVGKRLGFLVQELQREINTLGAKANDTRISKLVVEAKNDIERLREQVENVE